MPHDFDPGYGAEPFGALVADFPGPEVYPAEDFRVEWGPIFHRGRLDGSARVLVLGQDPSVHENVVRRILVGEAGQRVQGFLAKLGIERSYVMLNALLYGVYGQSGGERHHDDPAVVAYRNRWLDALLAGGRIEAVVAFGHLADAAWHAWTATPAGKGADLAYRHLPHPTQPESAAKGDRDKLAKLTAELLEHWNAGLDVLRPAVRHPDVAQPTDHYGSAFTDADLRPIPEGDLPPGLPAWMRALQPWAERRGATPDAKRRTIVITAPPLS